MAVWDQPRSFWTWGNVSDEPSEAERAYVKDLFPFASYSFHKCEKEGVVLAKMIFGKT